MAPPSEDPDDEKRGHLPGAAFLNTTCHRDVSTFAHPDPQDRVAAPALRPYQAELLKRIDAAIAAGKRRPLVQLPTGGGKTVVFVEQVRRAAERGLRVLIIVHRVELIHQTAAKLHAAGVDFGVIAAGFPPRPGARVQVGSIQTLDARAFRSRKIELPPADLIIVDEAHHAVAPSWRRVINGYPQAIVCGYSATPCRADGRGLA